MSEDKEVYMSSDLAPACQKAVRLALLETMKAAEEGRVLSIVIVGETVNDNHYYFACTDPEDVYGVAGFMTSMANRMVREVEATTIDAAEEEDDDEEEEDSGDNPVSKE